LVSFILKVSSDKEICPDGIDAVSGIPVAAHAEIVAATLVIQIVAEAAELPVLKTNTGETRAAGDRGRHHLHNDSDAPFFIAKMRHFIPHTQIESLSFYRVPHGLHLMKQTITSLFIQINGSNRNSPLLFCE
jgi:hypothetical protein